MVSLVWSALAISSGLLVYLVLPVLAPILPRYHQTWIGRMYYKLAMRSYRKVAIVRRDLGGLDMLPITIDDKGKNAEVELSSGMVGGSNSLPFRDPDNRIMRLFDKPLAVVAESVPAAVDAEIVEVAHWTQRHQDNYGQPEDGVDPYISVPDGLHVVDPASIESIVPDAVEPEWVDTAKELTRKRFEKYESDIGATEALATVFGFAAGAGGMAALAYVREQLLDSGGAGNASGPTIPLGTIDPTPAIDALVVIL